MAKEIWAEEPSFEDEKAAYQSTILFDIGQPNENFAQYFTGESFISPVSAKQVPIFNVTFAPSCRNHWHIHRAKSGGGQILICVGGRGRYRRKGADPVEMTPGVRVNIPPNAEHWHGAAKDSRFSHLAIEAPGEDASAEWLEPVSDEEYNALPDGE